MVTRTLSSAFTLAVGKAFANTSNKKDIDIQEKKI
jgi:hypothetical protein